MSLNTTPRTWVTGEVVTAVELNAEIRDAITALQAAWTAYTPTTGGFTLGNGTVTGRFNRVGKTIMFAITFTLGSTSAVTGALTATLPVTALSAGWMSTDCVAFDTSASGWFLCGAAANSTTVVGARVGGGGANLATAVTSSTIPFTWAVGDVLSLTGTYEAA